jgi:streptogramin lyase
MRIGQKLVLSCFAWVIAWLALCVPVALAETLSETTSPATPLESQLTIPGSQPLLGTEATTDAEEARLASPEAVTARQESQTKWEGLNTAEAAELAKRAFPEVIESPNGGLQLPKGDSATEYPTDHAAQVQLTTGERGVAESLAPIAVETSPGERIPVNLALVEAGGAFEPLTPVVGVRIPKQLQDGVGLANTGVSLTPIDASGTPVGGSEGQVDGAAVFYGGVGLGSDVDMAVKPSTFGFSEEVFLRSDRSPSVLSFRVGMPQGASLVQTSGGSGAVEVVNEGATIATIPSPSAQDAAGTSVPVSMSVSGDTLVLSVSCGSAECMYPVEVDPEVKGEDSQLVESGGKRSNWKWVGSESKFGHEPDEGPNKDEGMGKGYLETKGIAEYKETEDAFWAYQTKGVSKIYEFNAKTEGKNKGAEIESFLELEGGGSNENKETLSTELKTPEYGLEAASPLCAKNGTKVECAPAAGAAGNVVRFQQSVQKKPTNYSFSDSLHEGTVYLAEPENTHSETMFNTTSSEVEGEVEEGGKRIKQKRPNALYGSGGWLSKYQDAIEPIAKDRGIGVAKTRLEYESAPGKWESIAEHNYLEKENGCEGVQCYPEHKEYWTLNEKLPNGEDKIRYRAEEALSGTESLESEAESTKTVKVDTSPPHGISIGGLPYGNELSERPYNLTVYATDGEGTTGPSSGVKSIALYIDNTLIGINGGTGGKEGTEGKCSTAKGACTASAKWTINGAELGAGHHAIQVVAFDNAGNEGRLPGGGTEISIRHSTPVALGPGSVDLESGDFSLGATDVSMGSGLTVSRAYSSRATEEGDEGPLGPEWSMSLTSAESLVEMVDGSVLMTDANGRQAIFAKPLSGVKCESGAPFESPPGDSNLKLWCEENKETKTRIAYYLENAADHTKDKFTLPSGDSKAWVPTIQEGVVSTDTVSYTYRSAESHNEYSLPSESKPAGLTLGPEGDLWFTEYGTSKIGKITPTGSVTEYALPGGSGPEGITVGPERNIWFVDLKSTKVGRITSTGAITEYSVGSKARLLTSITLGPDGNLWFTEQEGIGKITPAGAVTEYAIASASLPLGITTGPDGKLWFTEGTESYFATGKIGTISTSGTEISYYSIPSTHDPGEIVPGPNGEKSLWFNIGSGNAIGKITTTGSITEYPLPAGNRPEGITDGPEGNLWFTNESNKVGKITPSGTRTEYSIPAGSDPDEITTGAEGNLWFADVGSSKIAVIPAAGTVTEPSQALAPVPVGVSCSWKEKPTEMQRGCRALEFKYAGATRSEIGEGPTEWGEYVGRLVKVSLVAYNPAVGHEKMEETPVAEYSYDKLGRLRAEWDPRISPALKTTYGYDEYGHVTALDPPGQEPWSLTYGTSAGDSGAGRLLKATRAPASESLWSGEVVKNTEGSKVTGTATVGVRLAVSNGQWSGRPLTYSYQWEECASEGQCTPILGATNANYTPVPGNVGHTVVAVVTATNGGGSNLVVTAPTAAVAGTSVTQSVDSGSSLNAVSCIPATTDCVISDSKGNAFYATNVSVASNATWTPWSGPGGESPSQAVDCPTNSLCLLADGKESAGGKLYYATSLGGAFSEAYSPSYGVDTISCASSSFCVDGQDGGGYFRYSTKPASTSWELEAQGSAAMRGVFCLSSSFCAIADGAGSVHVAATTTQIESSSWTSTDVDGTSALNGVACTSTSSCVAVDGAGNVLDLTIESSGKATASKHDIDGTNSLTAVTCTGSSTCVAVDNAGNIFISTNHGESWTKQYSLGDKLTGVSCASTSLCIAVDTTGNTTAFTTASTGTEGELHAPQPGTTIDYNVPIEGEGAPEQMGVSETTHRPEPEKWGQSDDPVEATAITPADSPQGWPASSYKRATVYYLDEGGRLVNTASPSTSVHGSIATTEYNEFNDVTRVLTPGNRETALKEECESESNCASAKKAKLLSTENTYNGEGEKEGETLEPGTRLILSRGPEHMVKYVAGEEQYEPGEKPKEAMARSLTKYYYNEGAPAENPRTKAKEIYDLVTKTQNYAELTSENNNETVDVRTTKTSYSGQDDLGWELRAPTSVTVNPGSLNLTTTTEYYETGEATGQVKETRGAGAEGTFTYTSKFGEAGTEAGKLKGPFGMAVDSKGDLWVADEANNRIEEFGPEGKYISTFGKPGSEAGQLKEPKGIVVEQSTGDIWVAEAGNSRVQKFNSEGKSLLIVGKAGSETGDLKEPTAVALDSKGDIWVADTGNNRIEEFGPEGKYITSFSKTGSEPGQLKEPKGIAIVSKEGKEYIWVADTGNNRIQEFSPEGKLLDHFGESGAGAGQFNAPLGIAFDASGHLWVTDKGNSRIQELSTTGTFITQFGWQGSEAGQLTEPRDVAIDAKGDVWTTDYANNRLEEWSKGPDAHDSKTMYYTSEENKESSCGSHPEWAGLICETLPAKQPELADLPKLPVRTTTYNMWDEPETIEETFGSGTGAKKRTTKDSYDAAGRLTSGEETSTATTETTDKALPKVTNVYNESIGLLETQSTTVGETTKTITSKYNKLGQLETYTDADGNIAKFKYGGPEKDGLLEETSDSSDKGESSQKYTYEETTKALEKLTDSAAGTFTASYDAEGKLTSEVYPNGMCANYTYNSVDEATRIEYIKTTNCSENKPSIWYSDELVPSIRGEMMSQTSTLASETYSYDQFGRLTEVQETPTGEGCTTRLYAYEEASNRTSLTTRKPGTEGKCASEGGTVEAHNYDEAGRLTDSGITYDPIGNVTKLPSSDAEGHALESTFYVDDAVATQTQNGVTNNYYLDPDGRVRETVTGSKKTITHYDGSGEAVAWTGEGSGETEKWKRDIAGIDGSLTAIQEGEGKTGKTPVLQLHDLQGDIVATINDKAGETELLSKYNSTEFGVPNAGKEPPKYAWLGAGDVERSLASGVITEGATSYVPQTGRSLQSEEVEPPGAPEGSGVGAPYTDQLEPWVIRGAAREASEAPGIGAAEEREAFIAACKANPASCGGIDPPHILFLFTPAEAFAYGEALCNCGVVHDAGKVIEEIVQKVSGIEGAGAAIEAFLEGGAVESFGKLLRECGKYLGSNGNNRCALEIDTWEIPVINVDTYIPTSVHVGLCFYYRKSYKKEKVGLHCPNGKYYKKGSY